MIRPKEGMREVDSNMQVGMMREEESVQMVLAERTRRGET